MLRVLHDMKALQPGDRVAFKPEVIRRTGNHPHTAGMRGTVMDLLGGVARIECAGTYDSEDGRTVRWIPTANLRKIKP